MKLIHKLIWKSELLLQVTSLLDQLTPVYK